jgi:zinc-ribbon domain
LKRCVDCGKELPDKDRFCARCGSGNLIVEEEPGRVPVEEGPPAFLPPPPSSFGAPQQAPAGFEPGPPKKPASESPWFWVVIGLAVVLVAAGAFVIVWFTVLKDKGSSNGTGKKTTTETNHGVTDTATSNGDTGSTSSTKPAQSADLNTWVSSVHASSVVNDKGTVYVASNIRDNRDETCWAEGLGNGQYIEFFFSKPVLIDSIKALPGYKKFNVVDRYLQNSKPKQVSLTFDNGTSQTLPDFDLAPSWSALDWQTRPLATPVTTSYVRVTILSTYPGQNMGGGHPATNDVSTSEFHFWGRPVGNV